MTDRAIDRLEGYWLGEFVLGEAAEADAEGADAPVLPVDRLSPPEITVRGRNLAVLLAPAYRAMTS
ncbi:hypothetical protein P3T37_004799 [Kitasatospora sp. MAA4]|uniref:hypothetical protein n=1 Tax=Kitasatospora sp. MAA4 TaxID=3035093 RepID=UPI0024768F54|nr:hypothetical protein [Kitasatospora sp. MAA4]MDH6135384.1 hypothetical protein [Kitasatospora sp. MAA4]